MSDEDVPIYLYHLGESLVARIVNAHPKAFLNLCGLAEHADLEFVHHADRIAFQELQLLPYDGVTFDGASKVDLVVRLSVDEAVAFEIKLGRTRLSKARIDRDWLGGCDYSHDGSRLRGNMMSILERSFPSTLAQSNLRARLPDGTATILRPAWFMVTRGATINSWARQGKPSFSEQVQFVTFESIVDCHGSIDDFNELVRNMLSFDYYKTWIT